MKHHIQRFTDLHSPRPLHDRREHVETIDQQKVTMCLLAIMLALYNNPCKIIILSGGFHAGLTQIRPLHYRFLKILANQVPLN